MKHHIIDAAGITARELQTSNLPPEFIERLFNVATWIKALGETGQILPVDDHDADASEAIGELDALIDDAWRLHSKPANIDPVFLRQYFNERHAAEAAAASANGALDLDDDADAALAP